MSSPGRDQVLLLVRNFSQPNQFLMDQSNFIEYPDLFGKYIEWIVSYEQGLISSYDSFICRVFVQMHVRTFHRWFMILM